MVGDLPGSYIHLSAAGHTDPMREFKDRMNYQILSLQNVLFIKTQTFFRFK